MIVTLILSLSPIKVSAYNNETIIEEIRAFIYTFDNLETEVVYKRDLKDINDKYNFALYEIIDEGYAIVAKTNGNIIDIKYGYMPNDDEIYYLGPNTFSMTLPSTLIRTANTKLSNIKEATHRILNEENHNLKLEENLAKTRTRPNPSKPSQLNGGTEVGIADSRMDLFNDDIWVVQNDSCGAYAGAAMVSYMDKYFGGNYIKETIPISSSKDYGKYIIGRFRQYINGGVTTFKTLNTINTIMMADYPKGGKTGATTATESTYKSKIKSGRPMIFFLSSWKTNNDCDGHFVLAYRYVDYNGYLWFKAYDGWNGNSHRGWINRNWIENGIYLN